MSFSMKDVTLNQKEQARLSVLNSVLEYQMPIAQAAEVLAAYRKHGAAGLAHGNRGRRPHNAPFPIGNAIGLYFAILSFLFSGCPLRKSGPGDCSRCVRLPPARGWVRRSLRRCHRRRHGWDDADADAGQTSSNGSIGQLPVEQGKSSSGEVLRDAGCRQYDGAVRRAVDCRRRRSLGKDMGRGLRP